jgi:hypothetical protein
LGGGLRDLGEIADAIVAQLGRTDADINIAIAVSAFSQILCSSSARAANQDASGWLMSKARSKASLADRIPSLGTPPVYQNTPAMSVLIRSGQPEHS